MSAQSLRPLLTSVSADSQGSGVTEFMKPKLAVLILLYCIPFVGPWEGAVSARVPEPTRGIPFASSFLPVLDFNFDDLDVRDAENRPVLNTFARLELTTIFVENLLLLGTSGTTHQSRELWAILDSISHLLLNSILNAVKSTKQVVEALLQTVERRLVHNVDKLWISFSVDVKCRMTNSNFRSAAFAVQPIPLRC